MTFSMTKNVDSVILAGGATLGMVADAFYVDLAEEIGEAPGQLEAFDQLVDYLKGEASEIWYGAMMGFGLGLAVGCAAEVRAAIMHAAGSFLLVGGDEEGDDA